MFAKHQYYSPTIVMSDQAGLSKRLTGRVARTGVTINTLQREEIRRREREDNLRSLLACRKTSCAGNN